MKIIAGCLEHERTRSPQRGFTLVELMIAIVVLMVGAAAVTSLVGYSVTSNFRSKNDTVGVTIAESQCEVLKQQSFASLTAGGSGNFTLTYDQYGNVKATFTGSGVASYSTITAIQNANQAGLTVNYDIRWSITDISDGGNVIMKRIAVAAQKQGGNLRMPASALVFIKAR